VPLLVGLCVVRRRWHELAITSVILCGLAGPWYARNLVRYGVLTGTQEARAGVDLPTVLRVAPTVDWPAWLVERSGLTLDRQQFLFDVLGKHSEPDNRYKLGGPAVVGGESALQR